MELEDQLTSEWLSNKLKELGIEQDSYFYWYGGKICRANQLTQELRKFPEPVSAFSVAELGQILPSYYDLEHYLYTWKDDSNLWRITYTKWGVVAPFEMGKFKKEADARAAMICYLVENHLIKISK